MEQSYCERCGGLMVEGECRGCGESSRLDRIPQLPLIGFVLVFLLIAGFSVTRIAVTQYQKRQVTLAENWFRRGTAELNAGRANDAVEAFENALAFRDRSEYRLSLARALMAAGRFTEARERLLNLWEERPGDSLVNLQLAHLAASRNSVEAAQRYYEGAIYGVWPAGSDPYPLRADVRREFAKYLISNGLMAQAQAQLIALSAEIRTGDPAARKAIGDLFMQAGVPQRAYHEYLEARGTSKRPTAGLALPLARAAFAQNEFALAERWANTAVHENPSDEEAKELADSAGRVVDLDPFAPGIGEQRRAERVVTDFQIAERRMAACFPNYAGESQNATDVPEQAPAPAESDDVHRFAVWAAQLRPQMKMRSVRHHDDLQEVAMRFVYQSQQFAARSCSAPATPDDQALQLLGKQRWTNE